MKNFVIYTVAVLIVSFVIVLIGLAAYNSIPMLIGKKVLYNQRNANYELPHCKGSDYSCYLFVSRENPYKDILYDNSYKYHEKLTEFDEIIIYKIVNQRDDEFLCASKDRDIDAEGCLEITARKILPSTGLISFGDTEFIRNVIIYEDKTFSIETKTIDFRGESVLVEDYKIANDGSFIKNSAK